MEKAKNGIHEDIDEKVFLGESSAKLVGSKRGIDIETSSTSQLLKRVQNTEGSISETYAVTSFAQVSKEQLEATSSQGDSQWDSTGGVQAYSTIYYNKVYHSNGLLHNDMESIVGGWTIADNNLTLANRQVNYGQKGPSAFGSTVGQDVTNYPNAFSFSYSVPSSWKPVEPFATSVIGVTSITNIKRSTSNWKLTFSNMLSS